jgi:hypothetical protein
MSTVIRRDDRHSCETEILFRYKPGERGSSPILFTHFTLVLSFQRLLEFSTSDWAFQGIRTILRVTQPIRQGDLCHCLDDGQVMIETAQYGPNTSLCVEPVYRRKSKSVEGKYEENPANC